MDALRGGTYRIRTLGCQMNVHDSERMAGLLESAGMRVAGHDTAADVVVINTCAVRENADNRLYGNLGVLAAAKRERPEMLVAVAGCLAQKDREHILERAPWVDVLVGTHNLDALPVLLDRARRVGQPQSEIVESLRSFPSDLPVRRGSAHSAWVSISVGCNNTCTFCIVPSLRGRQRDRGPDQVLAEVAALAESGVREVTLLGQNVNAYGVASGRRGAFSDLLRSVGGVPGIRRVRFTSPHPRDFGDDVVRAMAETDTVMPHLHLPLQSGSDTVLRRMRRSYRGERYERILSNIRRAVPEAAITTDVIVGFPGESEDEFGETLALVDRARFAGAFTFKYSRRPGTPASDFEDQVPEDVVARRYDRLVSLVDDIARQENDAFAGRTVEVMVSDAVGRKDGVTRRVTGRAADNRLVHVKVPDGMRVGPGDLISATITRSAPHHLIADAGVTILSPFRASPGDGRPVVPLGMPALRG